MKDCRDCKHWGMKSCPNSKDCYALEDKPHFEQYEQTESIYPKIAYYVIVWLVMIPILPFLLLSTICDPIANWYCKFGSWLSNKLNL